METPPGVRILILLACLTNLIHSLPIGTDIDCRTGSTVSLGEIDEHYGDDIEYGQMISTPDIQLDMVPTCPRCDEFLDFIFIPSITNITVRAKKRLDTEALREFESLSTLWNRQAVQKAKCIIIQSDHVMDEFTLMPSGRRYYSIRTRTMINSRTLAVRDLNDHWPVFDQEEYRADVPETAPVGEVVVQVNAVDADFSEANRRITYSIQPPSTIFEVNVDGEILLKERLNYTVSSQYDFRVKAQDAGGLSNETRVIISIIDNLRPQFEYDLYEASIPENQVGPLKVLPASIKANTTGNHTIIYSIGEVSPSDYWSNFTVDQSTGIITVITKLNFEEIKDPITVYIKASLETDLTRTSNTTVTVHVENVNEGPVFHVQLYTAEMFSVVPTQYQVVQVEATDPDEGDSERPHYSLMTSSSMFAVEPSSGQVYVAGSVADESGKVTLQVKAEDPHGLYDTTIVEVTIKESASIDVVMISLNQEIGTVQNKSLEMEEALERVLGWSVKIISVSSSMGGSTLSRTTEIHILQREDPPKTYVSFIATEINGTNVIPKETVQTKIRENKDQVVEEFVHIYGPDVDIGVEGDGNGGGSLQKIIIGTVITLICISAILVGSIYRKKVHNLLQWRRLKHTDANLPMDNMEDSIGDANDLLSNTDSVAEDRKSIGEKPDLEADRKSIGEKPDLEADKKSIGEKPDLEADRKSIGEKPDLEADRKPIGEKPDLEADRKSIGEKPDLEADRKSIGEKPDLEADRKSIGEKPDLDADRKSIGEKPDLEADRKPMGGKPDEADNTKSMGGT